jgi:hypothetical protein
MTKQKRWPRSAAWWPPSIGEPGVDLDPDFDLDTGSPIRLLIDWGQIGGRWEPVAIQVKTVRPEQTGPITGTLIRSIPLGRLVDQARVEQLGLAQRATFKGEPPQGFVEAWGRGEKPRLGVEHYRRVADIYLAAFAAGASPTKAVAEVFHVSTSTAGSWVSRARNKHGLLPKTPMGKAGI